jgi:DNA-binding NarL/FixJ family response regulator
MTSNGAAAESDHPPIGVVVQQRQRFFRRGLSLLLEREPGIAVVGAAVSTADLVRLCADRTPHVAILDLDDPAGDPCRAAATVRAAHRAIRFVGLMAGPDDGLGAVVRSSFPSRVRRSDGVAALIAAVLAAPLQTLAPIVLSDDGDSGSELTGRERDVLALVGSGCTTREISERLAISRKTVENHKQRIFSKLKVRNQAHAVAVAMRAGLITVDGVLELTDAVG